MGSRTKAVGRCTTWVHAWKSRRKSLFLNRSEGALWPMTVCVSVSVCMHFREIKQKRLTFHLGRMIPQTISEIGITASWQLELPRAFSFQSLAALTVVYT